MYLFRHDLTQKDKKGIECSAIEVSLSPLQMFFAVRHFLCLYSTQANSIQSAIDNKERRLAGWKLGQSALLIKAACSSAKKQCIPILLSPTRNTVTIGPGLGLELDLGMGTWSLWSIHSELELKNQESGLCEHTLLPFEVSLQNARPLVSFLHQ